MNGADARRRVEVALLVLLLSPRDLLAQCPLYEWPPNALVFHGTVRDVTKAPRITFDVDRVWRGRVSRRFDVLHPFQGTGIEISEGLQKFEVGESYLVVATLGKIRTARGTPASAFIADVCLTHAASLDAAIRSARERGRAPR